MTIKAKRTKALPDLSKIKITSDNIDDVLQRITRIDKETDPAFIVVDLFCGAGGTTTGIEMARLYGNKIAKVIACVNHDAKAILSHWQNHRDVLHFEEDIRTLDLSALVKIVNFYRILYPNAKLTLWASLECTNFSKAKGGQPRDADSRTLADYLHRYVQAINPDMIHIENVVEFMSWGPLDKNGKPVSRKNGEDWLRWRKSICAYGYIDDWRELNSADFGAYTSRNRLFGQFVRNGLPIVWPEATHSKKVSGGMFGSLAPWKPVKDVLDFADEGKSVFDREKPLSDKTFERIYAGLIKYVAGGNKAFIQKHFSGKPEGKVVDVEGPTGTITTSANQSLIQASFLLKYNSMSQTGIHTPPSVQDPAPTITCQPRMGLVQPAFITKYYGNGNNISGIHEPAGTLTTKNRMVKVQAVWLDKTYSGPHNHQSVESPAGTIMTNDHHRLVQAEHFVMPTNFDNQPSSIEEPLGTVTANRKWHYLVNPTWGGNPGSTEAPCPTLIARQDKAPLYLVVTESGEMAIQVFDSDPEIVVKIKQFMAAYGIIDIKMRMLKVPELLKIQGFPDKYKLEGSQADQKKFIGNSVHPLVPKAWYEEMASQFINKKYNVA